jgi:hypothetical protein
MLGMESRSTTMGRVKIGDVITGVQTADAWVQVDSEIISVMPSTDEWLPEAHYYVFKSGESLNLMDHSPCVAITEDTRN